MLNNNQFANLEPCLTPPVELVTLPPAHPNQKKHQSPVRPYHSLIADSKVIEVQIPSLSNSERSKGLFKQIPNQKRRAENARRATMRTEEVVEEPSLNSSLRMLLESSSSLLEDEDEGEKSGMDGRVERDLTRDRGELWTLPTGGMGGRRMFLNRITSSSSSSAAATSTRQHPIRQ